MMPLPPKVMMTLVALMTLATPAQSCTCGEDYPMCDTDGAQCGSTGWCYSSYCDGYMEWSSECGAKLGESCTASAAPAAPSCDSYNDCSTCTEQGASCGWCGSQPNSGGCFEGSGGGPTAGGCSSTWAWTDDQCPSGHQHTPHQHSPHTHSPHTHSPHQHDPTPAHQHSPHQHSPHTHQPEAAHQHSPHQHSPEASPHSPTSEACTSVYDCPTCTNNIGCNWCVTPGSFASCMPNDQSCPAEWSFGVGQCAAAATAADASRGPAPPSIGSDIEQYTREHPYAAPMEGKAIGLIVGGVLLFLSTVVGGVTSYCYKQKRAQQAILKLEERNKEVELKDMEREGTIVETETSLHAKI